MRPTAIRPSIQLLMAVVIFAFSATNAWFAFDGLRSGRTYFPKRFGALRTIAKEESPTLFWACISFYTIAFVGLAAVAGWQVVDVRAQKSVK